MPQTPLTKARWALRILKEKHGYKCKCDECITWMRAIANARRKQKYG